MISISEKGAQSFLSGPMIQIVLLSVLPSTIENNRALLSVYGLAEFLNMRCLIRVEFVMMVIIFYLC